ncbi:MAG: alpha/beta hydrolase [Pseudomonadota bacterium]
MKRFFKWLLGIVALLLVVSLAIGYTPDTDPAEMKAKYGGSTSQFLTLAPGLIVHVRDEGKRDGPALVLIHGSNSSLHTWVPWVKRLGGQYRIISLDLPGHGLTGRHPSGDYDYPIFVAVVDQVLVKLGISRAVIAGNSMGGGVTWMYALTHPEKVEAMILVDAAGAPRWEARKAPIGFRIARMPVLRNLARIITPRSMVESSLQTSVSVKSVVTPAAVDRYWELLRYPGNRTATVKRFSYAHNHHPATNDMLAALKIPTLVLWGEEDNLIPVKSAKWFAEAIPGSILIIYPKVGHLPMEEVADQSASDVAGFLKSLKSLRSPKPAQGFSR